VTQIVEEFGKEGAEERVMQACEGKDVSLYVGNHAPTNMIKESKGLMEFVTNSRDYAVKMAEVTLVSQVGFGPCLGTGFALYACILPARIRPIAVKVSRDSACALI
jgi:hypothetical protein